MQKVAIVGLPNAGKSTLFNRLIRKKAAIVSSAAHTTRDRKEDIANLCGLKFIAIDTGGFSNSTEMGLLVTDQIRFSLKYADAVLFMIDAKIGTNVQNIDFAKWLRKQTKQPIILVVNKCESSKHQAHIDDMEYLGFWGPVYISAEHNLGMPDLYEAMAQVLESNCDAHNADGRPVAISVIGQPNVGKSTFINSILGEERVITDSSAGTTRDPVSATYCYNGIKLVLTDTAGMRKNTAIFEDMEKLAVKSAINALSRSNVALLIVDFTHGISQQDLSIACAAIKNGKAIVLVLNKSDLIDDKALEKRILAAIKENSRIDFDVPVVKISALKKIGCHEALNTAIKLYDSANTRISTAKLNKWLAVALDKHAPHLHSGKRLRLKYITQIGVLPPTFVVAANMDYIEPTYQQYLKNSFIKHFSMQGVPIRMIFKKNRNTYDSR